MPGPDTVAGGEKRVLVPRPSSVKRIISAALLILSAGLLFYVWWGWSTLY